MWVLVHVFMCLYVSVSYRECVYLHVHMFVLVFLEKECVFTVKVSGDSERDVFSLPASEEAPGLSPQGGFSGLSGSRAQLTDSTVLSTHKTESV